MAVTTKDMMMASQGVGAGTGAGTAGSDGAVGAGYTTSGAFTCGTEGAITIGAVGAAVMVNVPDRPSILTL